MTIRELLIRKKRKVELFLFVLAVLMAIPYFVIDEFYIFDSVIGWFFIFFITALIAYGYWNLKCPKCKNNLGSLLWGNQTMPFTFSKKITCCPYCSVSFDENA
jgi:hypothetical protein